MNANTILVLILLVISSVFSENEKYCELESCPNGSHTLCKFQTNIVANSCRFPVATVINEDDIKAILDFHNVYRWPDYAFDSLEWDEELANIAQRWARQCKTVTDTCRNVDRFNVTQRVSMKKKLLHESEPLICTSITWWYDLESLGSMHHISFGDESLTDDDEIPWGKVNRIGCGLVRTIDHKYKKLYFVCNYGYMIETEK